MTDTNQTSSMRNNVTLQKVFIAAYAGIFLLQFAVSTWTILSQPTDNFDSSISLQTLSFYLIPIAYFCITYWIHPSRIVLQRIFESLLLTVIAQIATSLLQQILYTTHISFTANSFNKWRWGSEAFMAVIYFFMLSYLRFVTKVWK